MQVLAATYTQHYTPVAGNVVLSALVAALPIIVLLGLLGLLRVKAHLAALAGLVASLLVAIVVFGMPVTEGAAGFGTPIAICAAMLIGLGSGRCRRPGCR